jgi:hypothetical protein
MSKVEEPGQRTPDAIDELAAIVWVAGWGCWALGIFWVIPNLGQVLQGHGASLTVPARAVVDLAAFLALPWIALPVGLCVLAWARHVLASRRRRIRIIAWIADGLLWLAGLAAVTALVLDGLEI